MSTTSSRDTRKTSSEASAVGARNDDSSLFSLASLMRVEHASAVGSATTEDSGLIDLNALGAIEKKAAHAPTDRIGVSSVLAPPDLFPMSASTVSPTPSAPLIAVSDIPPDFKPKHRNVVIGIGASAALALGVMAFLAMNSGASATDPVAGAASAATAPPPPVLAPAPAPPPASVVPVSTALTPGQAAPKPEAAQPVAPKRANTPRSASKPAAAPAPKAAPKPAAETCDLACQMQRAVNGH